MNRKAFQKKKKKIEKKIRLYKKSTEIYKIKKFVTFASGNGKYLVFIRSCHCKNHVARNLMLVGKFTFFNKFQKVKEVVLKKATISH